MLPEWEHGTVGVLCAPDCHAIPVSTALRAGPDRLVFALGRRRSMLTRLRAEARASFCLLGEGVAFTAFGPVAVIPDELDGADVTVLEMIVERLQDHLADGRTELLDGARWRWRDAGAADADQRVRADLARLVTVRGER